MKSTKKTFNQTKMKLVNTKLNNFLLFMGKTIKSFTEITGQNRQSRRLDNWKSLILSAQQNETYQYKG